MINTLENLANEILLNILSNLAWFEMIESFWGINKRFNSLICLVFSMNNDGNHSGIIISEIDLSLNKYQSILCSINSYSTLSASIKRIHIDGAKSIFFDIISEWIFQENLIRFVNLKSLILTRCCLSEILINNVSLLVQYQLDELILTIDKDFSEMFENQQESWVNDRNQVICKHFIRQLFSSECQLTSLRLDISEDDSVFEIRECLSSSDDIYSNRIYYQLVTNCITLRHLHVHLIYGYFIEHIIEHVPVLEILSIRFRDVLAHERLHKMPFKQFTPIVVNWYDKVPKLKCFILKSKINDDSKFVYLKWFLNNVNHVEKLKLRLDINIKWQKDLTKRYCFIDANFIRQYCMPDTSTNLIDFNFYIVFKYHLLSENIQTIENSFKIHEFFIDRRWINVKCFFNPIMTYQHISSISIIKPEVFDGIK
ncbi:unnamed protein product [Rotaria sp. Silwood2]|nr:unnamed protein product [Rotaria sp. Silwood2]